MSYNGVTSTTRSGGKAVSLADCPIGLFMCRGELCLKTEYGNNEGRIDAYIVSSGEFFWGAQPQSIANQRAQIVVPVEVGNLEQPHKQIDFSTMHEEVLTILAQYRDDLTYPPDADSRERRFDHIDALLAALANNFSLDSKNTAK